MNAERELLKQLDLKTSNFSVVEI